MSLFALLAGFCVIDCGGDDSGMAGQGGASETGGSTGSGGAAGKDAAPGSGGADGATTADASPDSSIDAPSVDAAAMDAPPDASAADAALDRAPVDAGPDRSASDVIAEPPIDSSSADVTAEPATPDAPPETAADAAPSLADATADVVPDTAQVNDATAEAIGPDTGPDATTAPSDAAGETSVTEGGDGGVTFAQVTAFFSAPVEHCTNCHGPGAANRIDLTQTGAALYSVLTTPLDANRDGTCGGGGPDGGNRIPIVPGSLDSSFLWLKITGTQPTGCGGRMPLGCNPIIDAGAGRCLGDADTQIIRDWILEGAPGP